MVEESEKAQVDTIPFIIVIIVANVLLIIQQPLLQLLGLAFATFAFLFLGRQTETIALCIAFVSTGFVIFYAIKKIPQQPAGEPNKK